MIRARARQLNYQVKSFLAVHTNSSQNWMLLNHGDDYLILRNVGQNPIDSCLDPHDEDGVAEQVGIIINGALSSS